MQTTTLIFVWLAAVVIATAEPRVKPTERYKNEMLRLMLAEANRVAHDFQLDEKLPVTLNSLDRVRLIPAGKTWGHVGGFDTKNYIYNMDIIDSGVVVSSVIRRGYADFMQAKTNYTWPISRYDTNQALKVAEELMLKTGFDVHRLNRECRVRVDAPENKDLFKHGFYPIYTVGWHQITNTFHVRAGQSIAWVEFIEPERKIRQIVLGGDLPDSRYNLRKPLEPVNFLDLLTPENSREAVLHAMVMGTNFIARIESMRKGGMSEEALKRIWADLTTARYPTNWPSQITSSVLTNKVPVTK